CNFALLQRITVDFQAAFGMNRQSTGNNQCCFRHAITGFYCISRHTNMGKAGLEAIEYALVDGFCTAENCAQCRQIPVRINAVFGGRYTHFQCEAGCGAGMSTVDAQHSDPSEWRLYKMQRRHKNIRATNSQGLQQISDQAHVMKLDRKSTRLNSS